jgi:transposase
MSPNTVGKEANKKRPDPKKVLKLYRSGLSTNKIGTKLGYHKSVISKIVNAAGELRFRTLTDNERATAVQRYKDGESAPRIAKQMGVASPAIYLALTKFGVPRRSVSSYSKEEAIDHLYFSKIDTQDKAYWLGFLLADGCVTTRSEIILSLKASDAQHLSLWRDTIGSHRKIAISGHAKHFGGYRWFCRTARFVIKSNRLSADLCALGVIPAKTGRTIYPSKIPPKLEADFWRGAIDGDGWLCRVKSGRRRQLVLGFTGDMPIVEAFQRFVLRYIPTKAQITANGTKIFKFQVTDSYAYEIADVLYGKASVYLNRKRKVLLDAQMKLA